MIKFFISQVDSATDQKIYNLIEKNDHNGIFLTSTNTLIDVKMEINRVYKSHQIKVFDFSSLVTNIYKQYINEFAIINHEQQRLLFLKAIIEISDNLKVLNNYTTEIVDEIIDIYNKEGLLQLQKNDYNDDKTDDINLIISTYLNLLNDKYIDEVILYNQVSAFLLNNSIYQSTNIYINNIYYFNNVEKEIVLNLLNNSSNGYMVFITDKLIPGLDIAYENYEFFINGLKKEIQTENIASETQPVKTFLANNLYSIDHQKYEKECPGISIYRASDTYDEVVFIANQIRKNMRLYNYNYRDFMIVASALKEYDGYFDLIFKDNGIPYHHESPINRNFYQFIITLLDIIIGDTKNKTILKLLKFNYYNINKSQINEFSKHIYINNLEEEDFNFSILLDNSKIVDIINNDILKPLFNLDKIVIVNSFLTQLYNYLDKLNIIRIVNSQNKEAWNKTVTLLDNIDIIFGETQLNVNSLKQIMQYSFDNIKIENYYINEITVSSINNIVGLKPKVLFFLGINEGVIPNTNSSNLLINQNLALKYYLNYPLFNDILIDKFSTYYALTSASKLTYLSYYKIGNDGRKTNPASLIKKIKKMFPIIKEYKKEDIKEFSNLNNLVFNHYYFSENKQWVSLLNNYYQKSDKYSPYITKTEYIDKFFHLEALNSQNNGIEELNLSASKIDTYVKCPFQYFCQYILRLAPLEKKKYDNRLVGTYIHFLLEKVVKDNQESDINILLSNSKKQFIKDNLLNISNITNYFIDKLTDNIKQLWPYIKDDIKNNAFKPTYFELNISKKEGWHPLVLKKDDLIIKLGGIIDRVDIYENYYRIIDYKTGDKSINLNEFIAGLNLQLFIYLLFMKTNISEKKGAGMFYMPAYVSFSSDIKKDGYRLKGMFLKDDMVINGLGGENINKYVDAYSRDKLKEAILYSNKQLEQLISYTEQKILDIGNQINTGIINILPLKDSNACEYCLFSSICGIEARDRVGRKLNKYSLSEAWEVIGGDRDGELDGGSETSD